MTEQFITIIHHCFITCHTNVCNSNNVIYNNTNREVQILRWQVIEWFNGNKPDECDRDDVF